MENVIKVEDNKVTLNGVELHKVRSVKYEAVATGASLHTVTIVLDVQKANLTVPNGAKK